MNPQARLIAFYLPQFHPIPENDRWWGPGFTEWTNVVRARPLFPGHYQPHIPADLGFYDLRVPEVREAQAALARSHGIEGFCYWHYWFRGRRLLERPFNEVLTSGRPAFPFCLAWANEPWTRTWLGQGEILQDQTYGPEDDRNHARWLLRAFSDHRYLKVRGRPLFLVYRPKHLPDPMKTTDTLRDECVRSGMPEPYLVGINAWSAAADSREFGFDCTLNFEPQLAALPDYMVDGPKASKLRRNMKLGVRSARLRTYDYLTARQLMGRRTEKLDFPFHPSIVVGWDSTPRRGNRGIILMNPTPERFRAGLSSLVAEAMGKPLEERLVFINAWNEWAEGNHLEPDLRNGLGHLRAVRQAVTTLQTEADDPADARVSM
jgi:lipopolysaccharide biosynthesis protein